MQIPIMHGIYTDTASDFRTSYPRNMIPVPKDTGISDGYLRPAYGIALWGDGPGMDRGGINWNGSCYRVMGTKLVLIHEDGAVDTLGDVGGNPTDWVRLDYSFDKLCIASGGELYYWDGSSLTSVTDTDIGDVLDVLWVDGYFMTTDGTSLIVTELNDPYAVNPLKYGSSELDPDPVMGLLKLRDEVYAINRYTIEVFNNVGGETFPFSRVDGAQIMRGSIGKRTSAVFMDNIAFLGSGRNEPPSVWRGLNGETVKISTREIDQILQQYTEDELSTVLVESVLDKNNQMLYVHLPDRTWVFDGAASAATKEFIWFPLDSGLIEYSRYRAVNHVWCYNEWIVGDTEQPIFGYLIDHSSAHFGRPVGWQFETAIVYNKSMGAIFHSIELVGLPGRAAFGDIATIWTSYSLDGITWGQERPKDVGRYGQLSKRIAWLQQGNMRNWRIQRFRGNSDAHFAVARLEVQIEALNA